MWTIWWCRAHSITRFARSVAPPALQATTWWTSVPSGGQAQPGTMQPPSRTASALRCAGVASRWARPTSNGAPLPSRSTLVRVAVQDR